MKSLLKASLFGLLCLFSTVLCADDFAEVVEGLKQKSFSAKVQTVENLKSVDDPRVLRTLKVMMDGRLYYQKSDRRLVIGSKTDDGIAVEDVLSGESLGVVGKRSLKKVKINNRLRGQLKKDIAILEITSEDKSIRLSSAQNLTKTADMDMRPIIVTAVENETSKKVKAVLSIALATIDISSEDRDARLDAIEVLVDSTRPETVALLSNLLEQDSEGNYIEQDKEIIEKAIAGKEAVMSRIKFYKFFENLSFGLSLGSVLLLAAIGLAITFGVMGVINMAHGEMIMLGAYTTFAMQQLMPDMILTSLIISIPAAFIVSGSAGVLIERLVIRHLYGRPLDTLLATFGISLIIQQAVRTYRSNNVPVETPEIMSGFFEINGAWSITYVRIYIFFFSLFVLALLAILLKKTMVGLQMRAVTQNRAMATSMGIRSSWVDALTFGLGSGIAGIAGVALSQITNVGPNLGQDYIIDSFMVVVFGGVGSLAGTLLGATSLGTVNKFLEPLFGAVSGEIIVLIFIILFIQWRPRGLFALKGRFVED